MSNCAGLSVVRGFGADVSCAGELCAVAAGATSEIAGRPCGFSLRPSGCEKFQQPVTIVELISTRVIGDHSQVFGVLPSRRSYNAT
jgi:hypothetical protein